MPVTTDTLVNAAATLLATFVGAGLAFALERWNRYRQSEADKIAAVNRAQFVLISQLNTLTTFRTKSIDPSRDDQLRWVLIRPTLPYVTETRLDIHSLAFLLETRDPDFLGELLVEQHRFDLCLQVINERSRLYVAELAPRLEAAEIAPGAELGYGSLLALVGLPLAIRMENLTDQMIQEVDLTIASTTDMQAKFHRAMKRHFPKRRIIRLIEQSPSEHEERASTHSS